MVPLEKVLDELPGLTVNLTHLVSQDHRNGRQGRIE
jgi:hypothetical protein